MAIIWGHVHVDIDIHSKIVFPQTVYRDVRIGMLQTMGNTCYSYKYNVLNWGKSFEFTKGGTTVPSKNQVTILCLKTV